MKRQGKDKEMAKKFVEFLQSSDAAKVFKKWGWITSKRR